jgi:hypothetical protein
VYYDMCVAVGLTVVVWRVVVRGFLTWIPCGLVSGGGGGS